MRWLWHYVGETSQTIRERQEHLIAIKDFDVQRSKVARHAIEDNHKVKIEEMKMIDREPSWRKRIEKEALWTKKLNGSNKVMSDIGESWRS